MINTTVVHGRLTKEVKSKTMKDGKIKATFTLAVGRNYKNKEGEYEADFLKVEVFGNKAEYIIRNAKKGNRLAVAGRNQTRAYTDENGVNKIYQYIFASEVDVIDFDTSEKEEQEQELISDDSDIYDEEIEDMDLPF